MITILLADDHAVVRDGLRSLLEAQPDLKVIGDAENGREAVRQAAQQCPEVAILDIAMPELNGIEALRQINTTCPDTNVIILSMHATTKHILQALRAGARGYLLKESAGIEVVEAVRSVHAGRRHLSQKVADKVIDEFARLQESNQLQEPLERLSLREREVLQLVVEGKSSVEIANILSLSVSTVDTYRSRLMDKLGIDDLPSLVKFAIQQGLITLE
jgi:DNA-binding NarL/FixJ family response regulator